MRASVWVRYFGYKFCVDVWVMTLCSLPVPCIIYLAPTVRIFNAVKPSLHTHLFVSHTAVTLDLQARAVGATSFMEQSSRQAKGHSSVAEIVLHLCPRKVCNDLHEHLHSAVS
jgi:hypothetical protein